jgi:hypothetical protein
MTKKKEHELVTAHECTDDIEAQVIISFLESEGIEAFLDSDMPHSVWPVSADANILVNKTDADKARALIAEHQPHKKTRTSPAPKRKPKPEEK